MTTNRHDDEYAALAWFVGASEDGRDDRTGVGTQARFGVQSIYDMRDGFPLLTTKGIRFDYVLRELLWMLSGSGDVADLQREGCPIWDQWADRPAPYGPAWRTWRDDWGTTDQIAGLEDGLKHDPDSRRHVVTAWMPGEIDNDARFSLPACHALFQCYVRREHGASLLDLQLYQRSADVFIGVPYNVASYALLLHMLAHVHGYMPGRLIICYGDAHVYTNHRDQIAEQLTRKPYPAPRLVIHGEQRSILHMIERDFELVGYQHHPFIPAPVAK